MTYTIKWKKKKRKWIPHLIVSLNVLNKWTTEKKTTEHNSTEEMWTTQGNNSFELNTRLKRFFRIPIYITVKRADKRIKWKIHFKLCSCQFWNLKSLTFWMTWNFGKNFDCEMFNVNKWLIIINVIKLDCTVTISTFSNV